MQLNGWSSPRMLASSLALKSSSMGDRSGLGPAMDSAAGLGPDRRSNRRPAADAEASARAARARRSYDSVMERTPYRTTVGTHMA